MIPTVKAKLLDGKKGLIVGIANENSIAWGCAKAFRRCRARGDLSQRQGEEVRRAAGARTGSAHRWTFARRARWKRYSSATAFLAHDAARLITGETLYIDGGYHIID
jgi:enoyl-[acyl-carrier-protein] reductase (NADH)